MQVQFLTVNVTASGSGSAVATAYADGGFKSETPCPCPVIPMSIPDLDADADSSSDFAVRGVSATAGASSGESGASASAAADLFFQSTSSSSGFFVGDQWWHRARSPGNDGWLCEFPNRPVGGFAASVGSVAVSRQFTKTNPALPMTVAPEAHVTVRVNVESRLFDTMLGGGCVFGNDELPWIPMLNPQSPPPPPEQQTLATTISFAVVNADGSQSTTFLRGVLRSPTPSSAAIRLGIFNASPFAPDQNGNINAISVPISLGGTLTNPQSVSTSIKNEFFKFNSADIDGDGYVCWRDRVLVNRQVGKTLTDADYDPRADFDLDGTITSADASAYLVVYLASQNAVPPCPARCNGDVNYDGYVNTADVVYFLARFGQTGLPYENGDINGDGITNSADLTLLTGNFGATCL